MQHQCEGTVFIFLFTTSLNNQCEEEISEVFCASICPYFSEDIFAEIWRDTGTANSCRIHINIKLQEIF